MKKENTIEPASLLNPYERVFTMGGAQLLPGLPQLVSCVSTLTLGERGGKSLFKSLYCKPVLPVLFSDYYVLGTRTNAKDYLRPQRLHVCLFVANMRINADKGEKADIFLTCTHYSNIDSCNLWTTIQNLIQLLILTYLIFLHANVWLFCVSIFSIEHSPIWC